MNSHALTRLHNATLTGSSNDFDNGNEENAAAFVISGGFVGKPANITTENFTSVAGQSVYYRLDLPSASFDPVSASSTVKKSDTLVISQNAPDNPDYGGMIIHKRPISVGLETAAGVDGNLGSGAVNASHPALQAFYGGGCWNGVSLPAGAGALYLSNLPSGGINIDNAPFWSWYKSKCYTKSLDLAKEYDRGSALTSCFTVSPTLLMSGDTNLEGTMTAACVVTTPTDDRLNAAALQGFSARTSGGYLSMPMRAPMTAVQLGITDPIYFTGSGAAGGKYESTISKQSAVMSKVFSIQDAEVGTMVVIGPIIPTPMPSPPAAPATTPNFGFPVLNYQDSPTSSLFVDKPFKFSMQAQFFAPGAGTVVRGEQYQLIVYHDFMYVDSTGVGRILPGDQLHLAAIAANGGQQSPYVRFTRMILDDGGGTSSNTWIASGNIIEHIVIPPNPAIIPGIVDCPIYYLGSRSVIEGRPVTDNSSPPIPLTNLRIDVEVKVDWQSQLIGITQPAVYHLLEGYEGGIVYEKTVQYMVIPNESSASVLAGTLAPPAPSRVREIVITILNELFSVGRGTLIEGTLINYLDSIGLKSPQDVAMALQNLKGVLGHGRTTRGRLSSNFFDDLGKVAGAVAPFVPLMLKTDGSSMLAQGRYSGTTHPSAPSMSASGRYGEFTSGGRYGPSAGGRYGGAYESGMVGDMLNRGKSIANSMAGMATHARDVVCDPSVGRALNMTRHLTSTTFEGESDWKLSIRKGFEDAEAGGPSPPLRPVTGCPDQARGHQAMQSRCNPPPPKKSTLNQSGEPLVVDAVTDQYGTMMAPPPQTVGRYRLRCGVVEFTDVDGSFKTADTRCRPVFTAACYGNECAPRTIFHAMNFHDPLGRKANRGYTFPSTREQLPAVRAAALNPDVHTPSVERVRQPAAGAGMPILQAATYESMMVEELRALEMDMDGVPGIVQDRVVIDPEGSRAEASSESEATHLQKVTSVVPAFANLATTGEITNPLITAQDQGYDIKWQAVLDSGVKRKFRGPTGIGVAANFIAVNETQGFNPLATLFVSKFKVAGNEYTSGHDHQFSNSARLRQLQFDTLMESDARAQNEFLTVQFSDAFNFSRLPPRELEIVQQDIVSALDLALLNGIRPPQGSNSVLYVSILNNGMVLPEMLQGNSFVGAFFCSLLGLPTGPALSFSVQTSVARYDADQYTSVSAVRPVGAAYQKAMPFIRPTDAQQGAGSTVKVSYETEEGVAEEEGPIGLMAESDCNMLLMSETNIAQILRLNQNSLPQLTAVLNASTLGLEHQSGYWGLVSLGGIPGLLSWYTSGGYSAYVEGTPLFKDTQRILLTRYLSDASDRAAKIASVWSQDADKYRALSELMERQGLMSTPGGKPGNDSTIRMAYRELWEVGMDDTDTHFLQVCSHCQDVHFMRRGMVRLDFSPARVTDAKFSQYLSNARFVGNAWGSQSKVGVYLTPKDYLSMEGGLAKLQIEQARGLAGPESGFDQRFPEGLEGVDAVRELTGIGRSMDSSRQQNAGEEPSSRKAKKSQEEVEAIQMAQQREKAARKEAAVAAELVMREDQQAAKAQRALAKAERQRQILTFASLRKEEGEVKDEVSKGKVALVAKIPIRMGKITIVPGGAVRNLQQLTTFFETVPSGPIADLRRKLYDSSHRLRDAQDKLITPKTLKKVFHGLAMDMALRGDEISGYDFGVPPEVTGLPDGLFWPVVFKPDTTETRAVPARRAARVDAPVTIDDDDVPIGL